MKALAEYMKIDEMKDGYTYRIDARNASVGIWDAKEIGFHYRRYKFGSVFPDIEYHWDIGDIKPEEKSYGTAKPLAEIEQAPEFENVNAMMEYLWNHTKAAEEENVKLFKETIEKLKADGGPTNEEGV